ncbi:hypothetical protein M3Y97_01109700 [Aphelenchoides bicaudatus]|nr:hypothetical protein M3Y97_01109700 [Aphelenchoides bicaudatus]
MIWTALYYFLLACIGYYAVKLTRFFISVETQRRKCRNIPGPEALPLIGSLHKFPKELPKLEAYFQEESRKVIESGSNLLKIWYGPIMRIYPLDSDAVKPITNSNVEIVKSEEYDYLKRWLGNGLLTSHGEHWQQKRKLLTPAFHFQKLEEYNQIIDYHVRVCLTSHMNSTSKQFRRAFQLLNARAKDGQEIDFIHYAKYLTLDIIMQTAMGIHLNLQEDNNHPYVKAVTKFGDLLNMRIMNPFCTIPIVWQLLGYENETQKVLHILKGMSTHKECVQTSVNDGEQKRRPDFS